MRGAEAGPTQPNGNRLRFPRHRPAERDGAAGAVKEVERLVTQIRRRWPRVQILLRADSGICREELLRWCEDQGVDYVLGLARNQRRQRHVAGCLAEAKLQWQSTGKAARVLTEFVYCTHKSWSRSRRVVAKAEYTSDKENPLFLVTSLADAGLRALYEDLYCARGEMESRIKEQLSLFSDRLSTETLRATCSRARPHRARRPAVGRWAASRYRAEGDDWRRYAVLRFGDRHASKRITGLRIGVNTS